VLACEGFAIYFRILLFPGVLSCWVDGGPFLREYCASCHGAKAQAGGVLPVDPVGTVWDRVVESGRPQPDREVDRSVESIGSAWKFTAA
jgi:hypothetical protein